MYGISWKPGEKHYSAAESLSHPVFFFFLLRYNTNDKVVVFRSLFFAPHSAPLEVKVVEKSQNNVRCTS